MQDTWEPHWTLPTLPEAANVLQNGVTLPHPKVSLTSSCLLIPHLLNQLLPLLPKQFLKKLVSVFCLLLVALGFPWLVVASLPSLLLSSCGLFPSMSLCVLSSSHQSSYLETTLNPRGFQLEIHN